MDARKILAVDDDPEIREVLRLLLTGEGYEVVEAADGDTALGLLDSTIDLVILDVTALLIFFSLTLPNTAKALVTVRGGQSRLCTPKQRSGKPVRLILKRGISIFTSTAAVFKLSNFTTPGTQTHMEHRMENQKMAKMKCSCSERSCGQ